MSLSEQKTKILLSITLFAAIGLYQIASCSSFPVSKTLYCLGTFDLGTCDQEKSQKKQAGLGQNRGSTLFSL